MIGRLVNRQRFFLDIDESRSFPEFPKLTLAEKFHVPRVLWLNRGVECDGFIPEESEHLHALVVIPYTGANDALRTRHTAHLADRFVVIRDEVHHEEGHRLIK